MAEIKRVQFERTIKAPVEVVWAKMLDAEGYRAWTRGFAEGSYYDGSWSEGSRIRFLCPSGDGMLAEIAELKPRAFISIRHIGIVANGEEDTESESVRAWAPVFENYTFEAVPGGTRVVIDQDMTSEEEGSMRKAWAGALALLAGLCESEGSA